MQEQHLPTLIAPFKLARQGQTLDGVVSVEGLERLAAVLSDNDGVVDVSLQFGKDLQGINFVRGHLSATVNMVCQRCMKPMPVAVEADVSLGIVFNEKRAAELPDGLEALIVEEEPIALARIVEDELILALPIVTLHENQDCEPVLKKLQAEADRIEQAEQKINPFAALSDLKRQH